MRTRPIPIRSNITNVAKQRQLNDQGRALAREIGEAMRKLKIPVGQVVNQPVQSRGRDRHAARLRRRHVDRRHHRGRSGGLAEREQSPRRRDEQACRDRAAGRHQRCAGVAQAEHHGCIRQGLVRRARGRGVGLQAGWQRRRRNSSCASRRPTGASSRSSPRIRLRRVVAAGMRRTILIHLPCVSVHASMRWRSMLIGRWPSSRIASWKARRSKRAPRRCSALARNARIASSPIL